MHTTLRPFAWIAPESEAQAAAALLDAGAVAKAGGVDLVDRLKLGLSRPARVVNLLGVPSLRGVRLEAPGGDRPALLHIGPTTTLAQLAGDPALQSPRFAALQQAAGSAAGPAIRNVATVGGNLLQRPRCWYFRHPDFQCLKRGGEVCFAHRGENRYHAVLGGGPSWIVHPSTMATALVALEARLRIAGRAPGGEPMARDVAAGDFFVLPREDWERENRLSDGELLTGITVPGGDGQLRSAYRVVKERQGFDWPLAEVAVAVALDGDVVERARVVLGAAAPIPWRARDAEAELVGRRLSPSVMQAAGRAAVALARPLAHNAYKVPMLAALVERTLGAVAGIEEGAP